MGPLIAEENHCQRSTSYCKTNSSRSPVSGSHPPNGAAFSITKFESAGQLSDIDSLPMKGCDAKETNCQRSTGTCNSNSLLLLPLTSTLGVPLLSPLPSPSRRVSRVLSNCRLWNIHDQIPGAINPYRTTTPESLYMNHRQYTKTRSSKLTQ